MVRLRVSTVPVGGLYAFGAIGSVQGDVIVGAGWMLATAAAVGTTAAAHAQLKFLRDHPIPPTLLSLLSADVRAAP